MKKSVRVSGLLSGHDFKHDFKLKFSKRLNSLNNAGGVTVIVSAHCLFMLIFVPNYIKNISELGFQSYLKDKIFTLKFTMGHNSVSNIDGVLVLVFCTSSDHFIYLYQVL